MEKKKSIKGKKTEKMSERKRTSTERKKKIKGKEKNESKRRKELGHKG